MNTRSGSVFRTISLVVLALAGANSPAHAGTIDTTPPGLLAGQTYRLAFVTSGTTDATSTDISSYNAFVQSAAASDPALAALGATWTAIVSTGAVNAVDNISWAPATDLIYGLDGTLVSDPGHLLFYDSNDGYFDNPIPTDENGNAVTAGETVWTGTSRVGTNTVNGCCTEPLGGLTPFTGQTGSANVYAAWVSNFSPQSNTYVVYAISSELTAGAPEPGTIAAAVFGAILLIVHGLRRRRRPASVSA